MKINEFKKFVRTKDTIFELEAIYTNDFEEKTYCVSRKGERCVFEKAIKSADTIEKLCDGIIVKEKDKPNNWFIMEINEFEEMDKEERLYQLKDYNFNAFIKTDKGLLYVAKMNDKGELELI